MNDLAVLMTRHHWIWLDHCNIGNGTAICEIPTFSLWKTELLPTAQFLKIEIPHNWNISTRDNSTHTHTFYTHVYIAIISVQYSWKCLNFCVGIWSHFQQDLVFKRNTDTFPKLILDKYHNSDRELIKKKPWGRKDQKKCLRVPFSPNFSKESCPVKCIVWPWVLKPVLKLETKMFFCCININHKNTFSFFYYLLGGSTFSMM